MNNAEYDQVFNDYKKTGLSDAERSRMRNELVHFMSEHPAQAPWTVRVADRLESALAMAGSRHYVRVATAALSLVLVVGVGTSYAAENALPGDALYPVKVNFNEAIVGALAISESAKAQWNATRVSRRLTEAERLAAQNKLTPVARAEIETQINDTAKKFDSNIAALSKADDQPAVAAAQTDLEASLNGHADVLASLSDSTGDGTSIAPIISTVRAQAIALAAAREHVDDEIASAKPAVAKAAALAQKDSASESVGRVHAALASGSKTDDDVHASASIAMSAMDSGDQEMGEGDYHAAYTAFQTAARTAKDAEVHADAYETFGFAMRATTTATSTATSTATTTAASSTAATSTETR